MSLCLYFCILFLVAYYLLYSVTQTSQARISHILYCIVVPVFVWKYSIIKIYSRTRYNAWNLRLQVKGANLKI